MHILKSSQHDDYFSLVKHFFIADVSEHQMGSY